MSQKMEYPLFVYRKTNKRREDGSKFDTLLVNDESELIAAIAGGWFSTVVEALEGKKQIIVNEVEDDDSPPTREELKSKALELGIKFDGRTSDRNLAALIAEALGE